MTMALEKFSPADIDKNSPIPYHYQLTELIRKLISQELWKQGDKLPSEREFCETFEISRITVRKALDALASEGLIQTNKGIGTFVSEQKYLEKWSSFPIGFTDSLANQGYRIETQVLNLEIIPSTENIAKELEITEGDSVVHLHRLRFIAQEPILLVSSYLPQHLVPGIEENNFDHKSLYQVLRTVYGIEIDRVKRGIEAVAANEKEAKQLHVKLGAPLLQIESTSYTSDGKPVEYFVAKRRGDRTRFEFELSKPSNFNVT
ncbi:MAG: GntR family transcriptional regulator [Anaerolineaceae bacterium]|nr:GntR family transcriptional regulator [Anaerolineaceae bacterium]